MARRKRFNIEKDALSFAKKVDGKVNDLRKIKEAKSPFTVTYKPSEKTKAHGQISKRDLGILITQMIFGNKKY